MNFVKYFENKYLKYVLMFLAATNLLTFIIKKKYDTVIFFIAISILTAHYTKNVALNLIISLITTNLFNTLEYQKEGLKDKKEGGDDSDDDSGEGSKKDDDDSGEGSKKDDDDSDEGSKKDDDDSDEGSKKDDDDSKKDDDDSDDDSGEGSKSDANNKEIDDDEEYRIKNRDSKKSLGFDKLENSDKSNGDDGPVGNNINYSETLETAYKNLQGLLGKDGIKGLTSQTNKLLAQQKNLMGSLKHMGPIIDDAQNTLKGFNLAGITKLFDKQKPGDIKKE
jgi:hypothetical protein